METSGVWATDATVVLLFIVFARIESSNYWIEK